MENRRIRIARILVTAPAAFLALGPALADFNTTHATNPLWPAHARLHTVWLVCTTSLIAVVALTVLWRRPPTRAAVLLGAALIGSVLGGFFVATLTQSLYGGSLADPNGIPFHVGSLDANLVGFGVLAVVLAVAAGLAGKRVA